MRARSLLVVGGILFSNICGATGTAHVQREPPQTIEVAEKNKNPEVRKQSGGRATALQTRSGTPVSEGSETRVSWTT